jgi:glycosyltransferase involved in cell wall biosynthesis
MATVDVIIPTYNRADMVGDAIQSVLNQSYGAWELFVVDDGSTDPTREVVTAYEDPRIHYCYQENRKLPGARNTGIRAGQAKYVTFLDSDDRFLPEKLRVQAGFLDAHPEVGLVASGWREVGLPGTPIRTHRPWRFHRGLTVQDWLYSCAVVTFAVMARRECLVQAGLFDEAQPYVEDWDLWLRMAYQGCKMAWAPALVGLRTVHADSMVGDTGRMSRGILRLFDKFFAQSDLPDALQQQRAQVYANAYLSAAVRLYGGGESGEGRQHLRKAVALDPSLLEGDPPAVLRSLASTALTYQVRDVERYIRDLCDDLPALSPRLARTPRQFRALIQATQAFAHLFNERRFPARLKAAQALLLDPRWLKNRGLLGILLRP